MVSRRLLDLPNHSLLLDIASLSSNNSHASDKDFGRIVFRHFFKGCKRVDGDLMSFFTYTGLFYTLSISLESFYSLTNAWWYFTQVAVVTIKPEVWRRMFFFFLTCSTYRRRSSCPSQSRRCHYRVHQSGVGTGFGNFYSQQSRNGRANRHGALQVLFGLNLVRKSNYNVSFYYVGGY